MFFVKSMWRRLLNRMASYKNLLVETLKLSTTDAAQTFPISANTFPTCAYRNIVPEICTKLIETRKNRGMAPSGPACIDRVWRV